MSEFAQVLGFFEKSRYSRVTVHSAEKKVCENGSSTFTHFRVVLAAVGDRDV